MNKKNIFIILGITFAFGAVLAAPAIAESSKQVFKQMVVFKEVINVRDGIKNSDGNVKIKDNLKVKGNLSVEGSVTGAISASNILLGSGDVSVQGSTVESTDLQTAIDTELAVDITEMVKGKTWTVTNTTTDTTYTGTTGQVTFGDDGTFTLDSGFFAAIGSLTSSATSSVCNADSRLNSAASFNMYGPNTMYVTWTTTGGTAKDNVLQAYADNLETLTLVGQGGSCGQVGVNRISTLTLVDNTQ